MPGEYGRPEETGFDAEHERRVLRLLEELLDADGAVRRRTLAEIEKTDPGLAGDVRRLIEAEDAAGDNTFLGGLLEPMGDVTGPAPAGTPERIGSYRVLKMIGEGASGVVYACADPELDRSLAVKVLDRALLRSDVRERFRREAETLSRLSHPNIAKVHAVDLHDERMPYIAMELIDGPPIDTYLRRRPLTIRQRCELFLQLAEAVAHAHTKGVIHRDLKPSNVLVEDAGGRPLVRVIDFGVAMTLGLDKPQQQALTHTGAVLGTLVYMSPEQLTLIDEGVDTRSDVYALGLLLHEMLAGVPAYGDSAADSAPLMAVLTRLRDAEPPVPSRAIRDQAEPALPYASVPGELDWIVARATARRPADRYSSAEALSKDVERFLSGLALEAAPPSRMYLARKFLARHRAAATAALLVFVVLIAATAVSVVFAVEASRERAVAESARADLSRQLKVSRYRQLTDAIDSSEWRRSAELLVMLEPHRDEWLWRFFDAILNSETSSRTTLARPSVIAVSPDGERLCVGTLSGELEIVEADGSRQPLATNTRSTISSVCWRSDGQAVIVVHGESDWAELSPDTGATLRVGRSQSPIAGVVAAQGREYRLVTERGVLQLAFSDDEPDGMAAVQRDPRPELQIADGGTLVLRKADGSGREITREVRHLDALQYDDMGRRAIVDASTGDGEFFAVVDLSSGEFERVPLPGDATALRTSISPDGKTLFVLSRDGMIRVYRIEPLTLVYEFPVHLQSPTAFTVDHTRGEIHIVGRGGILRTWQTTGHTRFVRAQVGGRVYGAGFTQEGAAIVFVETPSPPIDIPSLRFTSLAGEGTNEAVPLRDGSGWISASRSGTLRLHEASGGVVSTEDIASRVHALASFGGARPGCVVAPYAGGLLAFEAEHLADGYTRDDLGFIRALAVDPSSGRVAAADREGMVHLLDRSGSTVRSIETGRRINALRFGRNGRRIVAGDTDGGVTLWSLDGPSALRHIQPHSSTVTDVFVLPGGEGVLSAARNERLLYTSIGGNSDTVPLPRLVRSPRVIRVSENGDVLLANRRGECVLVRPDAEQP